MKIDELILGEKRICIFCQQPLAEDSHGNSKAHKACAYRKKKLEQKEKYRVGNSAKLVIQKNEAVAARLYEMDQQKQGIPYLAAMEYGLKFSCPTTLHEYQNREIHFFDKYGYTIETINKQHLIFIYHESELL